MDTDQQTCSICGAVLIDPASAAPYQCSTCVSAATGVAPSKAGEGAGTRIEQTVDAPSTGIEFLGDVGVTVDLVRLPADPTRRQESGGSSVVAKNKFGRFQVLAVLGQGAFGTVYHAYDPLLDRQVALKVPRFRSDDLTMLERFHREAKSAARLHHPNIVTLYENGQTAEAPYLVYEYVDGETMFAAIKKNQFDVRTAVDWVRQISEALHYAHTEGIVHRDIKPANIMINRAGRPRVMDFGLAKRDTDQDSHVTIEGQILGTPSYMSPEQARGAIASIGAHSDQYSVGVVLYELLCGCTPFTGPSLLVMSQVGNWKELPPTPRSIRPEIPHDLEACCLKAIEKDPKLRYPNLQALAEDLDHWLKGLPLVARPIGPIERLTRWCRKNRLIASLTGTLAAILLVMAVVGPWLAYRFQVLATKAENEARDAKTARRLEQTARLDAERILIDNYTESGLSADRAGDPRTAVLWFGNAIAAAENHPERERYNRIRFQSWLPQFAVPIHAFSHVHTGSKGLTYHPDGKSLLCLPTSGEAEWMDLTTQARHSIPLPRPVTAAIFSLAGDCLYAASGTTIVTYEYPSGSELDRWENPEPVTCLQCSPNGKLLFVGGDRSVQIRDLVAKAPRSERPIGSHVLSIELSPDGQRFAVRSADQKVRVYSTSQEPSIQPLMPPQPSASEGEIMPLFVANDRLVITDNEGRTVTCWDVSAQTIIWQHPVKRVLTMALSPNRQYLALGDDFDVIVLDVFAADPFQRRFTHRNLVHGLGFHPKYPLLLTASNDHSVHAFDIPTGRMAFAPIPHNTAAHRCVWSPDGSTFATVNWGGRLVRVWKMPDTEPTPAATPITADGPFVRFNAAGDRWLSSGFDANRQRNSLDVINAGTGTPVGAPITVSGLISDADFIPGSSNVIVAGGGGNDENRHRFVDQDPDRPGFVKVFDAKTGRETVSEVATPSQPIAVRVSSDGATGIVLCHRSQVLLLDMATGSVRNTVTAMDGAAGTYGFVIRDRIRVSPQNSTFAVWGGGRVAELRDLQTGKLLFPMAHTRDYVHDVQFSPDGSKIASCSSDHTVRIWNATTGQSEGQPLNHPGWVFSAQFNRDGNQLLTACDDHHARLWDLARGKSVLETHEQRDQVFGVCMLPGEEIFVVSDRTGQLTAWETRFGKMIAPTKQTGNMVYQLSLSGSGKEIVASGRLHPCRTILWRDWIVERESRLTQDETRLMGELLSGQWIHEGGAVTNLTSDQWIERWDRFHSGNSIRLIVGTDQKP